MISRQTLFLIAFMTISFGVATMVAMGAALPVAIVGGATGLAITLLVTMSTVDARVEAEPPIVALPARPSALYEHPDFAALIEALGTPVLLLGSGRVLAANHAAEALLGDFIIGADVRSAIRHPGAVDRLIRPEGTQDDAPVDLVGLGMADQRWQMRIVAMPQDQRLVLLTDQTARDAVDRMRADFVANASHELRTPLAAILGYVETLSDPDAGDDRALRQRFLSIIDAEARRMQQLVLDLLSMSRIESQKHVAPTDRVAISHLVEKVISQLQAGGGRRSQDIRVNIQQDVPDVAGDEAQLSQVLFNIIGNAMKYGRDGTAIAVDVAMSRGGLVRISVSDKGDGIAPEHLPRLTERFYRIDSARSRALGGTGLGLAIVRHAVERHRGELDIRSDVGVGTTVTVRLPAYTG